MLLSLLIIPVSFAQGQKKYTLEGKVTLSGTEEPIPYANVLIKELNLWAFTNADGSFKIVGILPGTYNLEASSLGYQKTVFQVKIIKDVASFRIQLKEDNLTLDDVVVTAKAGATMNSSSRVDKQAIQHLQASSLADIMQLVPGSIIKNPDLTSANVITIRSIDANSYNARGVGLLVNGSKVSDDAKLSSNDPLDFRKMSTDNIESMEVLKGIVSAEYGDITSGAILVTTKAGRTPYEVRVKSDPRTKAVSFSKGFSLGKNNGNLNVDVDYARAFKTWISPVDIFDRTTMGITYSTTFMNESTPLRFNVRASGYITGNSVSSDPDVSKQDFSKTKDNNFSLSVYGSWMLNKSWISSLNYNLSGNYGRRYTQNYQVTNQNPLPTTNTLSEGINLGYFTSTLDKRDKRVEDIPIYFNAKLSGNLNKSIGKSLFKTIVGVEFNTKGNKGRGEYYEGDAKPQFFRERKYSDVPFMTDISAFAEEKMTIPIGKTSFEFVAGVRANQMIIKGYNYDPTIDPRFNAKYNFIQNKRKGILRGLSLRAGWGVMQRLPSIGTLYPAPEYIDNTLFQYRNSTTNESMALIQTSIINELLPYNLKPERTTKYEVGLDFNIAGIEGVVTYFNEYMKDGITSNALYMTESYDYYSNLTDPNAAPKFENGRIWVKDGSGNYVLHTYTTNKEFKWYARPDNRGEVKKWGVEYDLNFGKIKSLNTSVIVSGAYIKSENTSPGFVYNYSNSSDPINPQKKLPYVAIYEGDNTVSVGNAMDRLSTNINFVTNIPSIRMVVTLTTQCIWMQRSWNLYDEGKIYKLDSNGQPIYGNYNNVSNTSTLYRDPVAYMDLEGNVRPFSDYWTTTDSDLRRRLNMLRTSTDFSYYFLKTSYNPFFMANIRVTKELGKLASLSFYANNFTNSTPIIKNNARPDAPGTRVNTPIYFGAELKLTF